MHVGEGGPIAANVARGMALLFLLASVFVVARLLFARHDDSLGDAQPVCTAPVEVVEASGAHLGCASDPELQSCGELSEGARVIVSDSSCRRDAAGMRASWRLIWGIKLDLNHASVDDLALLEGVGPKMAGAIVAYRDEHGPFSAPDELAQVRGIGPATARKLEAFLTVFAPRVVPPQP